MSGRILIIDDVATNRITLRVNMLAAQFMVEACATASEAQVMVAANRPDIVLINMSDANAAGLHLCTTLRSDPATTDIAIIAVGIAGTPRAQFAALMAGADDVMPHPTHEALLLARIRRLLRARSAIEEFGLRDSHKRTLGFADRQAHFVGAGRITLIAPQTACHADLISRLNQGRHQPVLVHDAHTVLCADITAPGTDVFVIPAERNADELTAYFGLVSDLRARVDTRQAGVLVVVPADQPDIAALFLDLGADDVIATDALPAELTLRIKSLVARKQLHDAFRRDLRDGLQAAVTDPLTGLFNRRYVDHHLTGMRDQSIAAGSELAVMIIDIDHFKAINDAYGHPAGDRVLVALAARLRHNLRAIDLVARIGGEEFLVAMPRTTPAQAQNAANRLRKLISQTPFDLGEAQAPARVTISVGVALSGEVGITAQDTEQMCHLADTALYHAKAAGRDRVAMHRSTV